MQIRIEMYQSKKWMWIVLFSTPMSFQDKAGREIKLIEECMSDSTDILVLIWTDTKAFKKNLLCKMKFCLYFLLGSLF